jgi:hypothetical protein
MTLQQLAAKIEGANSLVSGRIVRDGGKQIPLIAGQTLQGAARDRQPAADDARRPSGLCARRRQVDLITEPNETRAMHTRDADGSSPRRPPSRSPSPSAPAPMR